MKIARYLVFVPFVISLLLSSMAHSAQSVMPADPHDLSGVWMNDNTLDETLKRLGKKRLAPGETLGNTASTPITSDFLTDEYKAIYTQEQAALARLAEGVSNCEWPGLLNILSYPYPFEVLHTPGRITFIYEADSQVRRIFLDRDEHLPYDELDPTYNGDSIGHWEGNTLVIDTVGLNQQTKLWGRLPHSEQVQVVERISWLDAQTIQDEVVITDSLALKEPVTRTLIYAKRPDWRIREYSCLENNRDQSDSNGNRAGGLSPDK